MRPMGNTYVDTKIASEHIVLACHSSYKMDCTIIRPGDVYGPASRPWVVLPLEMIAIQSFGGKTELGRGTIDMLSRQAGYAIAKAERILGYKPQVSLGEGMARTEVWARDNGLI